MKRPLASRLLALLPASWGPWPGLLLALPRPWPPLGEDSCLAGTVVSSTGPGTLSYFCYLFLCLFVCV